jgi:pyrroline-5-carboxylate reductase
MMAGKPLELLESLFGKRPIIRITPNMPAAVGSGVSLYAVNSMVTAEENEYFHQLMEPSGLVEQSDEKTMAFAGGVKGCGPAFTAMFVEALADGAVAVGLPREKAYLYAAQMIRGTAEMLLETGEHPGVLKDSVCSPGGSTIRESECWNSQVSELPSSMR